MTANKILSAVRVGFAVLFLWLVLAGNWVNLKKESFGVFDSHGGAGFGIVAVVLGVLMLLVSLTLAAEKEFTIKNTFHRVLEDDAYNKNSGLIKLEKNRR